MRAETAATAPPPPTSVTGGRISKADAAYEAIKADIVDGTHQPGSRLVLDQLARRLDVSAVPVREAIRRLEAEGYVTFQRNLGATVAMIDATAYGESMETLAILEGAATALAAPLLAKRDLRAAHRINEGMAASLDRLDPVSFTWGNYELHELIYRPCPNRHLVDVIGREWSRLGAIRRSTFAFVPDRARGAVAEHAELLARIEAGGSPAEIEDFARRHRLATARAFLQRRTIGGHE
ncbi:MAG: GntR family transcriptional regulator [Acidimicrobiales bacterium]